MRYWLSIFLLFSCWPIFAQIGQQIFQDSLLHEIRLQIDLGDSWIDTLCADYVKSNEDPVANPEFYRRAKNVVIDGQQLTYDVGIKMRGNFTVSFNQLLGNTKFPYKLAFDEFTDTTYDGLKKLNLNGNTNNPSFMHEKLAYGLMQTMGQTASQTAYVKLFVNDRYEGLYLMVENLDKRFLTRNYGTDGNDGNLYRALTSDLSWLGNDKSNYAKALELKTNENEADWTRLLAFLDLINNAPNDSLYAQLDATFDVENFLKLTAVERLLLSWDSYSGWGVNYYLYERNDGKITFVPWDYNETFQRTQFIVPPSYLVPKLNRPLLKAVFSQKRYRDQYLDIVCQMLSDDVFSVQALAPKINYWHQLIDEAYYLDPHPLNSYDKFKQSLFENTHEDINFKNNGIELDFVNYNGVFPFIVQRVKWASKQMDLQGFDCPFVALNERFGALEIFPNPAQEGQLLTIRSATAKADMFSKIDMYNTTGQLVYTQYWSYAQSLERQFNVPTLPIGFYIVIQTDADGQRSRGKFVIRN